VARDKADQINRTDVRQRLYDAFQRSGLTQDQLAQRCGAAKATVSDWFNPSKDAVPDGEKMARIPAALHVSGHWLLTGEGASVPGGDGGMKRAERAGAQAMLAVLGQIIEDLRVRYEGPDDEASQRAAKSLAQERRDADRARKTPNRRGSARRRAS
jgi:transcriptional regulator with XRE-family HTH domain